MSRTGEQGPPAPGSLAHELRRVLVDRGIVAVVDVGAHYGEFAGSLRTDAGFTGPIVSVEPALRALRQLRPQVALDPAWTLVEHGAGAVDGDDVAFTEYENDFMSSLAAKTDWAEQSWNFGAGTTYGISVRRLDGLAEVPDVPLLLKIDSQGRDAAVLEGAQGIWRNVRAVLTEVAVTSLYEGTGPLGDTLNDLSALGLDPIGFWPVSRDSYGGTSTDHLRVTEFDCLLLRRD